MFTNQRPTDKRHGISAQALTGGECTEPTFAMAALAPLPALELGRGRASVAPRSPARGSLGAKARVGRAGMQGGRYVITETKANGISKAPSGITLAAVRAKQYPVPPVYVPICTCGLVARCLTYSGTNDVRLFPQSLIHHDHHNVWACLEVLGRGRWCSSVGRGALQGAVARSNGRRGSGMGCGALLEAAVRSVALCWCSGHEALTRGWQGHGALTRGSQRHRCGRLHGAPPGTVRQ